MILDGNNYQAPVIGVCVCVFACLCVPGPTFAEMLDRQDNFTFIWEVG